MEEIRLVRGGPRWGLLRRSFVFFACYVLLGFTVSYVVALLRYIVYREHFRGADAKDWLKFI